MRMNGGSVHQVHTMCMINNSGCLMTQSVKKTAQTKNTKNPTPSPISMQPSRLPSNPKSHSARNWPHQILHIPHLWRSTRAAPQTLKLVLQKTVPASPSKQNTNNTRHDPSRQSPQATPTHKTGRESRKPLAEKKAGPRCPHSHHRHLPSPPPIPTR